MWNQYMIHVKLKIMHQLYFSRKNAESQLFSWQWHLDFFEIFRFLYTNLQFALVCMEQCTFLVYSVEQIPMGRSMIMSILYFIVNILSVVVLTPLTAVQDSSDVFHFLPRWILKTFLLHLSKENCFFMISLFCVLTL